MNILGDFISRVRTLYGGIDNEELDNMLTTITNQGKEIETKDKEIERLQAKLAKYEDAAAEKAAAKPAKKAEPKKPAAKKAPAKKAAPKSEAPAPAPETK